ncbi:Hypothetical_protein [Hexamita inflata]|uniref:Hypothetical_protein n=1 Tax=Hexamita inflata TaxID=28002 RepID=A0AA86TJK4_9EUKA|nr:Hypothetical protein HINF_LOCUS8339 [Hexamita inflata]
MFFKLISMSQRRLCLLIIEFLQYWYNLRFCDAKSTNVPTEEEAALDNDEDGDQSTKHEEYLSYSTKYEKEKKIVPTLIRVQTFSRKCIVGNKMVLNTKQTKMVLLLYLVSI